MASGLGLGVGGRQREEAPAGEVAHERAGVGVERLGDVVARRGDELVRHRAGLAGDGGERADVEGDGVFVAGLAVDRDGAGGVLAGQGGGEGGGANLAGLGGVGRGRG